jgi:hypothetical protein
MLCEAGPGTLVTESRSSTSGWDLWMLREGVIQRAVVLAVAVVALLGVAFVTSGSGPFASCSEREHKAYPELEAVAARTLPQAAAPTRTSACEETGRPLPGVSVEMPTWRTRHEAFAYFRARDWRFVDNLGQVSPDGTVVASASAVTQANRVVSIAVWFRKY